MSNFVGEEQRFLVYLEDYLEICKLSKAVPVSKRGDRAVLRMSLIKNIAKVFELVIFNRLHFQLC